MAYVGFKKLVAKGVPPGAAANIGREKYGKSNFQKHAAEGKKMKDVEPLHEGSDASEVHKVHTPGTEPKGMHETAKRHFKRHKKIAHKKSHTPAKNIADEAVTENEREVNTLTHDGTGKHRFIGMA